SHQAILVLFLRGCELVGIRPGVRACRVKCDRLFPYYKDVASTPPTGNMVSGKLRPGRVEHMIGQ
ncbi:hypothetical protein M404DRAFT_429425, partial [Pisolithus tinctorius Marx 270]